MTGETWRLGRRPALDGLRGVAVLMVVASHLDRDRLGYIGWAGVVAFFTLSGFLITALLLEEREASGAIRLARFYGRRLRRLAPALVAVVAVVTLLSFGDPLAPWALLYSSNWALAAGVGLDGPLAHTWSLGIEEQFYLVWPLLLLALVKLSRPTVLALLVAGASASLFLRAAIGSDEWARVYFGTDTRADALLIGCLVAVALHGRVSPRPTRSLSALAAAVLALLTVAPGPSFMTVFLPTCAALATAAMVLVSATHGGGWLAWSPLRYLGRRSYGLYLWHWPILLGLGHVLSGSALVVVALAASFAVAELSWRHIERPWLGKRDDLHDGGTSRAARVDFRGADVDRVRPLVGVGAARS